jgi:hypothetical protein
MEATQGQWNKPELTVLVRNRPEEAVLAACKGNGSITNNNALYDGCKYASEKCNQACTASAPS